MARPTTIGSLEKLGFEVLAYDAEVYHAHMTFEGQTVRLKGESATDLLAIARGWLDHISTSR